MSESTVRTPRILHCHSEFPEGQVARLSIDAINALGEGLRHEFAAPGGVAGRIAGVVQNIEARGAAGFPDFSGRPAPGRLIGLARAMAGYDLVLTYGRAAINIALAHKVFGQSFALAPLIHHETGLTGAAEEEFTWRRNWLRRLALGSARHVVVETGAAEAAAQRHWQVPKHRLACIRRGVAVGEFALQASPDALPGLIKRKDEFWIGVDPAASHASAVSALVNALEGLPEEWHLLALGSEDEAQSLRQIADAAELSHRVHIAGQSADLRKALSLIDIFVDLSGTYSAAIEAKQAMAAAKPVIASSHSEAALAVASDNRDLLEPGVSAGDLARMLNRLTLSPALRQEIGKANRARADELFDCRQMVDSYCRLYRKTLSETAHAG